MNALMLIQENIQPLVKLFPQLKGGRNERSKSNSQFFLFIRVVLSGSVPVQSYRNGRTGGLAAPNVPLMPGTPKKRHTRAQQPAAAQRMDHGTRRSSWLVKGAQRGL